MVLNSVEEAQKRITDIGGFSAKLEEVFSFLLKEHLAFKDASKKGKIVIMRPLENTKSQEWLRWQGFCEEG